MAVLRHFQDYRRQLIFDGNRGERGYSGKFQSKMLSVMREK